jgi:MoaA/NifB/PqqE/SkfB family radical SAM enzyme
MRTDAPLGDLFREGAFNYGRDLLLHHWKRIRAVLSGNLFVSPYEYEIQPTTRCNLRCAHCIGAQLFGKGNVLDLDPVAFEQFLHHDVIDLNTDLNRKQLSPKIDPDLFQVRTIKFLGLIGEPLTVFPKIEGGIRQLLEFNLKAAGTPLGPIALGLFTNGILLFDHPAMPDPLAIANWLLRFTYVNVSLDADSPATFSQSKGAEPKVFEIIIDNLRRLVVLRNAARSKLNITVSYTLNKMNWSGIRQITELLKNLGVDRLRFRMDLTNNQETGMSPSDIHSAYDQIEQAHHDFQQDNFEVVPIHSREEALQMPFTIHFSRCFAGYFMGTLAANGLNYGCDHQALPFSGGLRDIQSWLPPFDARKRCAICAPFTFKINLLMNYLADQIQKEPDFLDRFEQEVVDPLRRSFHRTEMRNLAEQLTPSALQALKFGRVFKDDRYRLQLLHGPHDELYVAKSVGWLAPTYEKILLDRERKMLQRFHRNGPTLGFPRPVTDILSWDSDEIEKPVQFDKDGTLTGFIMSYLPGVSGDAPEILSHTTSNTQTLWQILYQSAKLLKTVHDHSYVHRDICPSQYLIDLGSGNHPTLSLIDFETALPANARRVGHESKIRTSDFWELSWNRKLSWDHTTSPQFDIFSWGITAYLWTTGQKIPQGGDIPFLKEHPFGAILHKAAAVDRSKRYTSMDEILRDLEAIGRQLGFLSDQVPLAGGKPDSIRNEMRQHTADKDALWAMVSSESYRRHLQATHDRYTELFLQDPEVRTLADEAGWDDRELRQRLQDIRQTPKEDLHIHLEGAISTPGIRLIARYVHERMGPEEREKFWNNFAYHIDPRKKDVKIQRFSDVVSGDDMQTAILDPEGHDLNHLNVSRYTEHNPGWAPLTDTLPLITYLHRPYAMGALLLNPTILPQRLLDEVVYLAVADAALNALQDGVETLHLRIKADPDNVAINPDYLRSLISAARDVENRMQSEGKKIRVRFVLSFSRKIDSRVRAPKSQEPSAGDVEAYLQKHFIGPLDQLTGEEHEWLSGIDIVGNEAAGLAVAKRNLPYITYAVRQIQALRDRKGVKGKFMVDVHVGENFKDPETGVQMMELYLDGIDERDSHALIHGAALAAAQTNNPVRQNVVGKMAQRQTPLLISLSSNRHTGALDRLLLFPVAELEDQGLRLQASTDDPRASHTTRSLEQLKMDLIRAVQTIRAPRPEMRTNDIVPARSEQTSNTTGQITNHDSAIATKDADWDSPSLRELVVPLTDGTSVTGIVEELSQDTTTMKAGPVLHFKFSNGHELFIPLSSADALSSAGTRDWLKQEVVFAFEQGLYDYSDPAQLIESFLKTSLWKKNVYFIGNFSDDEMTRLFTGMDQTKLLNYIGKDEIPPGTQTAWDKIVRLAAVDLAARELVEYHDRLRKASLLAIKFLGDEDIPELLKDRSEPAQIDPGNALQETVARAIATPPQDGSFHKGNAFRDEMTLAVINARPSQEDFRTIFDHMVNARLKAAYRLWQSGIASERIIIKRIADARRFRLNGSGNLDNTTSMDKTDLKYRWLYGLIEQKFFANMAFSEGSSIRTYERKVPIGHRGFQHAQKIMMIGNNYIDIEHANSKDVPAGLAELEELWNTVKNASDRDKQYKALAEFEWLFFQINPASRSGAALGDALSLVLQIATGMKLRKGYIHLDQALAFSKDEYIVWRSEELRTANAINDGQTGEIHRPEMRAQDTILSYLRTYLDALQDPARSKALNTDGLEADGRRLIDVDITGVGSKRIKETEANDPADIYVSSDARDCALIITLSKSNTKADKPVRNLFHFFQSEETVNDFDAMLTGREKLMIIVYDEAETIFEQLPPVFIRAFPDLKFLLIRDKKNNVKNGIAMEEGFGLNVGKTTGQNVVPTAETSKLFALTWDELASLTADNPVTIIPIEELPQRQQALSQGSSQTRTEMRDLGQDLVENYVTKEFGTVPVRLPDELVRAYFGEQVLQDSQHKGRSFFIRKLDSNTDLHFLEEWKTQLQSDEAWLHQWAAKGRSREIAKGRFPYFGFISVQALGIISQAEGKETLEGFIGFEALHHTFDAKRRQFTSGINISQIEVYYRNLGHEGRIQGIPDLLLDILISMAADPNLNVTGGIQLNPMTPGSKAFATRRNFEAPRDRLRLLPQSRVQQEAERILETTPTIRRIVPYAPERHVEMRNTNPILPDLSPTIPQENDADHRESPPKEEQGKVVRPELRKAALEENKQTDIATPKSFEGRPEASNFKAGETTPSHILHLTQPVIAILEQARIDTLSPESFKELLEIAGLNNGKLHLVIPDVLKGKYSARVAELRKIATVHYHFPQLANSEDIPVIGFSDAEKDEHITEFQERLAEQDPSLAQRIKDSAFRLNRPGDFGVGIWYALKEIPPDAVRPDSSGFRGDRDGRYCALVTEELKNYAVFSASA